MQSDTVPHHGTLGSAYGLHASLQSWAHLILHQVELMTTQTTLLCITCELSFWSCGMIYALSCKALALHICPSMMNVMGLLTSYLLYSSAFTT